MQFGIFYEHQIPRPWAEGEEHQLFKDALEQVEVADRIDIEYVWEVEHHFLEEYSHSSAPEVFLAACSQRSKNIRLGHGIVLMPPNYNHPARVAERIATLDLISDGRVEWGTGESASRAELEGFNVPPGEKKAMWAETVRETAKMLASDPYPGYDGEFFSMPERNVLPKPLQKPHPPLWVACSNRESIRWAGKHGIGALTFAFIEPEDAKYWVDEYYTAFENECEPLGQAVNPTIAMVAGFMCHENGEKARAQGLEGFQFFGYALSHYYRHGTHTPGEFDIWADFQQNKPERKKGSGSGCIGSPDEIRAHLEVMEEIGVDQVVFLQQAGNNRHDHICESLECFAQNVLPEFKVRHEIYAAQKAERLGPAIEKALTKIPPIDKPKSTPFEAYPLLKSPEEKQEDLEIVESVAGKRQKKTANQQ